MKEAFKNKAIIQEQRLCKWMFLKILHPSVSHVFFHRLKVSEVLEPGKRGVFKYLLQTLGTGIDHFPLTNL